MKIGKLAIHLIAEEAQIGKVKASIDPEKFIELLVGVYNETKSEKGHSFALINTPNWNRAEHHNCSLKVYHSESHISSQAGRFVATLTNQPLNSYEDESHHFAFFVYFSVTKAQQKQTEKKTGRAWAIFVLTSNKAFRLVRPYCDYDFPTRIAFRLVKPKLLRKEISRLTGPKEAATSVYKDEFNLETHEYESLWVIYRNFDAKLRKKSSLSALLEYDDSKQIAIHIGEGMIRIGESLELDQYLSILSLLLEIRRGNPTNNSDQTIETDNPSFEALENIKPVDPKKAKELDRSLVRILWQATTQNNFATTLYLSHRRYRDYYQSTTFELQVTAQGSKRYVNWASRPTFHQLVEALRPMYEKYSFEEFENAISQAKFSSNGLGKRLRSLLEFIQGELIIEKDTYFRAGGIWLKAFGQHLATTEKAFRALISKKLARKKDAGKHVLSRSWISKEDWIAFSQLDIPKTVKPNDFELIFSEIKKHNFYFIDSLGKVVVPYLTRAILYDQDLKTIKSIKKKWEELSNWLITHKEKTVTEKDLHPLFPKNPEKAKKIFELLQQKYPTCRPIQTSAGKVAALAKDGIVQIANLKDFDMPKSAPKAIAENIDELSQLLGSQSSFTEVSLAPVISQPRQRKAAFGWLLKSHRLKPTVSNRYVFQGPLPTDIGLQEELKTFFRQKHEEFRLLMDEENYNRLFLFEPYYLVFDQIFPGKKDKIELFDLLYYGEEGKLYLYAIKEGFGTTTGIACTQIRVAAEAIEACRKNPNNNTALEKLYDSAISTKVTSSFRQQMAKNIQTLSKKEFVELFRKRKVTFVYAFLDTNPEDRRLENELDLQLTLQPEFFQPLTTTQIESEVAILTHLLITLGYLSPNLRFLNPFIDSTETVFKNSFEPFLKRVWQGLKNCKNMESLFSEVGICERTAQGSLFNVLIQEGFISSTGEVQVTAEMTETLFVKRLLCFKPETVYRSLWKMLSQFDSLIAKIELITLRSALKKKGFKFQIQQIERPGPKSTKALSNQGNNQSLELGYTQLKKATFHGQTFFYRTIPYTLDEIFSLIMGHEDVYLAQTRLYEMSENPDEGLLNPAYKISQDTLREATALSGYSLVIHDLDHPDQTPPLPKETPLILFKRKSSYFLIDKSELLELQDDDGAFGSAIDAIQKQPVPAKPLGIENRGNDCFMNAMLQLVIHSPLFMHLINKKSQSAVYTAFLSFALRYLTNKGPLSSKGLRAPLGLSSDGQEDLPEAFSNFLVDFDLKDQLPSFNISKDIDVENSQPVQDKDPEAYSPLEDVTDTNEYSTLVELPVSPNNNIDFTQSWEEFKSQKSDNSISFSFENQVFQADSYEVTHKLQNNPSTLFIQFLRFKYNPATKKRDKINTIVVIPEHLTIEGLNYEVGGFVNHYEDEVIPEKGHYTSHIKKGNHWFLCDDANVSGAKTFDEVKDDLSRCYVLMLLKKDEAVDPLNPH